jgi:hypothetical protein
VVAREHGRLLPEQLGDGHRRASGEGAQGLLAHGEPGAGVGPAMIGLLIGLEMQHRLDPAAVTDEIALASLRALLGVGEPPISDG